MGNYLGRRPFRLGSRMSNTLVLVTQLAAGVVIAAAVVTIRPASFWGALVAALIGIAAVCVWRIRIR